MLLWGGGVWGWLDPLTPMRAVAHAARGRAPRVHGRRAPRARGVPARRRTLEAARRRGAAARPARPARALSRAAGSPTTSGARWLAAADLGVSAHHDHLEARFAFRTRVLDYLWAGLPVVATAGDALAELVGGEGLGRTSPPGDARAFAAACAALLGAEGAAARERVAGARAAPALGRGRAPARRLVRDGARAPAARAIRARRACARGERSAQYRLRARPDARRRRARGWRCGASAGSAAARGDACGARPALRRWRGSTAWSGSMARSPASRSSCSPALLTKGRALTGADGLARRRPAAVLHLDPRGLRARADRQPLRPGARPAGCSCTRASCSRARCTPSPGSRSRSPTCCGSRSRSALTFVGALLYVRRLLPPGGQRHAALVLVLFAVMPATLDRGLERTGAATRASTRSTSSPARCGRASTCGAT